jgi:DNA-binding response OmpR family regulator
VSNIKTVLIVEDDENLSRGISFAFERDGYAVVTANTLKSGRICFEQNNIDIVILDLGLPDGNGMELCKNIREKTNIPIIMLTACDLETDEVSGLMAGADDYITKPFSLSVLRARVEAILRRMEPEAKDNHVIRSGEYKLDINLCKLYKENEEIIISATEFRLLNYFMGNSDKILTKEQILAALWDNQGNFVDENTLPVNISRLRAKIGDDPKNPKTIKTIHGMGYVWVKG